MRLIIFMIALISFGCGTTAPKPPVVPYCPIVAIEGDQAYLYCSWSDGSGSKWRVPIDTLFLKKEKYICTTDQGYADAYKYGQELNRWVGKHCK